MVLQDILDEYDLNNNFEYLFARYMLYLDKEGKWKFSGTRAKSNYKTRMVKLHNEGETEGREYKKLEEWVMKQMYRQQKSAERVAFQLEGNWKEKYQQLKIDMDKLKEETDKEISSLKAELKLETEKRITLMELCDSDSD